MDVKRPVPIELWGKDHWSTLAYLETRCVDHGGIIHLPQMRCDNARHPMLAHVRNLGPSKCPTRLADGVDLENHDDWDCVFDMIEVGLLKMTGIPRNILVIIPPGKRGPISPSLQSPKPVVKLTDYGLEVSGKLRAHKAKGGNFAGFYLEENQCQSA